MRTPLPHCLLLLLLGAAPAAAQQAEFGIHAGRASDERGVSHGALQLSAAARWGGPTASLRLSGSGALLDGEALLGSAGVAGEVSGMRRGALGLGLGAEAEWAGASSGYRGARGVLRPRLELAGGGWGGAVGPQLGVAAEAWPEGGLGGALPWGGGARSAPMAWRAVRGVWAEAWGGGGPLALGSSWVMASSDGESWRDLAARAELRGGGVAVGGGIGHRSGSESELWGSAGARLALGAGLALQAELGRAPGDPLLRRAGGRFATVGMRYAPGARPREGMAVRPRGGVVPLVLHATPGARVEIVGDFTDWRPVPVQEVEPGRFVYPARLAPGLHRFVFRVDGESRLPRGYASEPDAFGGRSAVVRVEA